MGKVGSRPKFFLGGHQCVRHACAYVSVELIKHLPCSTMGVYPLGRRPMDCLLNLWYFCQNLIGISKSFVI